MMTQEEKQLLLDGLEAGEDETHRQMVAIVWMLAAIVLGAIGVIVWVL